MKNGMKTEISKKVGVVNGFEIWDDGTGDFFLVANKIPHIGFFASYESAARAANNSRNPN